MAKSTKVNGKMENNMVKADSGTAKVKAGRVYGKMAIELNG